MDERLARHLFEDNIVERQKNALDRISLLEKLSLSTTGAPGSGLLTIGAPANGLSYYGQVLKLTTPGSNGYLIYNNGGVYGADSNYAIDPSKPSLKIGNWTETVVPGINSALPAHFLYDGTIAHRLRTGDSPHYSNVGVGVTSAHEPAVLLAEEVSDSEWMIINSNAQLSVISNREPDNVGFYIDPTHMYVYKELGSDHFVSQPFDDLVDSPYQTNSTLLNVNLNADLLDGHHDTYFQTALSFGNLTSPTTGVSVSGGTGAVIGSGAAISVQTANGSQPGLLSATDWNTFNNKQPAGNYITALTGDVTASGPGSVAATIGAGKVTNSMLAGSIDLTTKVVGVLPSANGGTGNNNSVGLLLTTNQGTLSFGAASKTLSVNKSLTLDGTDGKTLTMNGSLSVGADTSITGGGTFAATAGKTYTFPAIDDTLAGLGTANVFAALNTLTNLKLSSGIIYPSADSTTALRFAKADGTTIVTTIDTTNARLGINTTPSYKLHVKNAVTGFSNRISAIENTLGTTIEPGAASFALISGDFIADFTAYHNGSSGGGVVQFGTPSASGTAVQFAGAGEIDVNESFGRFIASSSTTNSVIETLQFYRRTTGTPASGIGLRAGFRISDAASANFPSIAGAIDVWLSNVGSGSQASIMTLGTKTGGGSVVEKLRILADTGILITGAADGPQLTVTGHTTQAVATPMAQFTRNDTAAGISSMLGLTALGSGAAGDGGSVGMFGKSSTTAAQNMALIDWRWITATHASRAAALRLYAYDTAARLGIEIEASGTKALVNVWGDTYFKAPINVLMMDDSVVGLDDDVVLL